MKEQIVRMTLENEKLNARLEETLLEMQTCKNQLIQCKNILLY